MTRIETGPLATARMASLLVAVTTGLLSSGLPAVAGDLPSVETILERHEAAIGGDALGAVKNRSAKFEFEMPMQGLYTTGLDLWQRPGLHHTRIDLSSSGIADFEGGVIDGVAWQVNPMLGTRRLSGDEERLALRGAHLSPFDEWQQLYAKAEVVGEQAVADKQCYKVVFTPETGAALTSYFDQATGLLVREEFPGPDGETLTVEFSDWAETQGITQALQIKVTGSQGGWTTRFTDVEYDVDGIAADAFDLPASLVQAPAN